MRILLVTPYYWPELFRITDVAAGLKARGHQVEVLTGLPNYPSGRFFEGYGLAGPYRQEHEGVPITRVPVIPRGDGSAVRLILTYLSFAFVASLRALTMARRNFDVVFVFQISPVTSIFPAAVIRALARKPVVAWVQDLWPEVVLSSGLARSKGLLRGIGALSAWLYRRCDLILSASRSFSPRLEAHGVPLSRIEFLPQWAEDLFTPEQPPLNQATEPWQEGFPIMFAGNIGRMQGLETVLAAAEMLRDDPEVRWVFLGDGSQRNWLDAEVERRGLSRAFYLLGRRPVSEMPAFFARSAVMLVTLKPDDTMALTVPAKVQSYLAAGRPIIGSVDGEAARVIEESGGGWVAPAGNPAALVGVVLRMKALSAAEREAKGRRGQEYSARHFSRSGCLDRLESALRRVAERGVPD